MGRGAERDAAIRAFAQALARDDVGVCRRVDAAPDGAWSRCATLALASHLGCDELDLTITDLALAQEAYAAAVCEVGASEP